MSSSQRTIPFLMAILTLGVAVAVATASTAGATGAPRMLGGKPNGTVDVRLTSSVVALASRGTGTIRSRSFCSGAVIAAHWVLTARHCVQDLETGAMTSRASNLLIARGAGDGTAYGRVASSNDVVGVTRILNAPGSWRTVDERAGDVSLVRLAKPMRTATPIAYAAASSSAWWGDGEGRALGAYAVGWGTYDAFGNGPMSAYARFAELPIISTDECVNTSSEPELSGMFICAGSIKSSGMPVRVPCGGDSGGPLITTDPATNPDVVEPTDAIRAVGVVSYSLSDNCALTVEHYTPIAKHATWIAKATGVAPAA